MRADDTSNTGGSPKPSSPRLAELLRSADAISVARVRRAPEGRLAIEEPASDSNFPLDFRRDLPIPAVTSDSRDILRGDLFVAVSGLRREGFRFVAPALSRGARVIVSDRPPEALLRDAGRLDLSSAETDLQNEFYWIRVRETAQALGRIASAFYGNPSHGFPVVGVTGTNGKTSTTYLLRTLFKATGSSWGLMGTVENDLLVERGPSDATTTGPVALQRSLGAMREAGAGGAILEVSSHALSQGRVEGTSFDVAIMTNLTPEHLDYHGNLESYFEAKARLFRSLDSSAVAILNRNCPFSRRMREVTAARVLECAIEGPESNAGSRARAFSEAGGAEECLKAMILNLEPSGTLVEFQFPGETRRDRVRIGLLGRHNVENAVLAGAAAFALGMTPDQVLEGLSRAEAAPGRLQAIDEGQRFSVLVDYAHTEDALRRVLQTLNSLGSRGVRLVMGCGGDRDRLKRPKMGRVAGEYALHTYVTSDNPRSEDPRAIVSEVVSGFPRASSYCVEIDRERAIGRALLEANPGEIVLVAGKGHEVVQWIGDRRIPFDDREVVRGLLQRRGVRSAS